MSMKNFFVYILLLYNAKAAVIEVICPDYCVCDEVNDYRRATCQNRTIVTVEIGIPPQVEFLDLSHNQISDLGDQIFSNEHLTELKLLNLSYNKVSQINLHSFEGLDQLKSLDLSYNSIQYFLVQWYYDLRSLRELYLRGNNLVQINEQPPLNLPNLKVLDLGENKIEHIHTPVFSSLPALEVLDLSDNFLIDIRVEVIRSLVNLRLLVASGNNINCNDRSVTQLRHFLKQNDMVYVGPCKKAHESVVSNSTEKFQKMIMEPTKPTNDVKSEIYGETDNVPGSERTGTEKYIEEPTKHVAKENEKLVESRSAKQDTEDIDDVNDGRTRKKSAVNSKPRRKQPTQKNAWIVDDDEDEEDERRAKTIIKYVDVCNKGGEHNFTYQMDKMIMQVVEISPSGFLLVSLLTGLMLGMIIATMSQQKNLGKHIKIVAKKLDEIRDRYFPQAPLAGFKLSPDSDDDKGDLKPKRSRPRDQKKKDQKSVPKGALDKEELSYEQQEEVSDFKPRSLRGKKGLRDDKAYLLDEEESQGGSTPTMSKRNLKRKPKDVTILVTDGSDDENTKLRPKSTSSNQKRGKIQTKVIEDNNTSENSDTCNDELHSVDSENDQVQRKSSSKEKSVFVDQEEETSGN